MKRHIKWISGLTLLVSLSACSGADQAMKDERATASAGTSAAQTLQAAGPTSPPSDTPEPTRTFTPLPPTATMTATITLTPTPVVVVDDFSSESPLWEGCDFCEWYRETLRFGPWPISGAYKQHNALCTECGEALFYRMAVDATYSEGPSERGFGLLVRLTEDYMLTFEITPWQTADLWRYDIRMDRWTWVSGKWTGSVNTGRITNRIEVEVSPSEGGTCDIALRVNGKTPVVVFNQVAEPGAVGLTIFGHATGAIFDNFEFEALE